VAEVGDLSGKHGLMVTGQPTTYYDGQVQLTGPFSVVGRSVVVHSAVGATRIGCCTIGMDFFYS
jgi:hypothetical protein